MEVSGEKLDAKIAIILIIPLWQRGSHYSSLWQREVGRDFKNKFFLMINS